MNTEIGISGIKSIVLIDRNSLKEISVRPGMMADECQKATKSIKDLYSYQTAIVLKYGKWWRDLKKRLRGTHTQQQRSNNYFKQKKYAKSENGQSK